MKGLPTHRRADGVPTAIKMTVNYARLPWTEVEIGVWSAMPGLSSSAQQSLQWIQGSPAFNAAILS